MIFFFISTQNYFISTCTIWQCNDFSPNINIADINNLFPIYLYTFALLLFTIDGSQDARLCLHHLVNNILGCRLESWGWSILLAPFNRNTCMKSACVHTETSRYACPCLIRSNNRSSLFTCRIFYWLKLSHVLAFLKYIFEENYYNKKIDYICSF